MSAGDLWGSWEVELECPSKSPHIRGTFDTEMNRAQKFERVFGGGVETRVFLGAVLGTIQLSGLGSKQGFQRVVQSRLDSPVQAAF